MNLLPLDSEAWAELRHAYGPASDIPDLLRQLLACPSSRSDGDAEPWFSLWSALCHQEDVYSASYAATPHIVKIGIEWAGPIDFSFFQLPACIEIARARGRGPKVPPVLKREYDAALEGLHECAYLHRKDGWDSAMSQSVACALAAAKGQIDTAEAIMLLDDDIVARILDRKF